MKPNMSHDKAIEFCLNECNSYLVSMETYNEFNLLISEMEKHYTNFGTFDIHLGLKKFAYEDLKWASINPFIFYNDIPPFSNETCFYMTSEIMRNNATNSEINHNTMWNRFKFASCEEILPVSVIIYISNLENCENVSCPPKYFKCPNFLCVPIGMVEDGSNDCPFGQAAIFITLRHQNLFLKSGRNRNVIKSRELTVAKKLALVALSDFLCWFPVGILGILSLNGQLFDNEGEVNMVVKYKYRRVFLRYIVLLVLFLLYKATERQIKMGMASSNLVLLQGTSLTPNRLIKASKLGDTSRISELGSDCLEVNQVEKSINSYTPLMIASMNGHSDAVKRLIDSGADVNAEDTNGRTSLFFAIHGGKMDIIQMIIQSHVDVNKSDNCGRTALMMASAKNYDGVVKLLIAEGADVNKFDANGSTALMIAAEKNYDVIVQILIDSGAEVNITDKEGRTALTIADEKNYDAIVKILVDSRAAVDTL
ncbi:hypothetical protein Btru_031331 [Bulinus truncatus]|nr:hypothetical protein Btru_031331 [Bulinus truncatus]